ncbi:heavy metal sensor histidine kinase [Vibrio alginolyticus]|jgi:two-component system heavy metal sensor histidine kinase CusS|uniref:Sensor protein n=1 Tax=Vibrio bivalvicida TaxID=1276888 RepID=A0A177Y3B8_9VIBR|nr:MULTISPECIES: heavy metal sensor histidine kinase [Vibrio]MDG2624943.1 heavy metal sensor histidine kinase [Vibrio parahaemolyticus]HAS6398115.1 heavy metal sensor histidine kinase [Vibrio vulnificus]HDI3197610.1 heavy metal sensor histidine kinase [Vibrio cholerae]EKA5859666.1 heavy metal sensor histidine kinase [Vibrio alginolyticus]EKD1482881.1 heavy metal sensor histidine kinase [Vibrio alginolyticus]
MKKLLNQSIARKLVFMFVTASFVVLVVFALTIQHAIKNHFNEQDYRHLETKLLPLISTVERDLDLFQSWDISAWILNNQQVVQTNNEAIDLPSELIGSSSYEWSVGNNRFHAFKFDYPEVENGAIVLAMNVTHHKLFFDKLNTILFWTLVLTLSLSGAYALIIVRNGLQPLKQLKEYIEQVNTSNLSIRIPSDSLPKELSNLIISQNEMLERLQEGYLRLSEFSSDIAHELRTPLNNILTQTQVALGIERSVEEYQDILVSNIEELERFNKTISDTLYLAKSENRLLHKTDAELELREVINPLLEYYDVLAEEKNVRFTLDGSSTLFGDKDMLQRAFGNVLSNALRHCFHNTDISVVISESETSNKVIISNVGEPIPLSSLPYIFERFYRSDKSRAHNGSVGAGLGLPIAKAIMKAHHGDILVNAKDERTEFVFIFNNL